MSENLKPLSQLYQNRTLSLNKIVHFTRVLSWCSIYFLHVLV